LNLEQERGESNRRKTIPKRAYVSFSTQQPEVQHPLQFPNTSCDRVCISAHLLDWPTNLSTSYTLVSKRTESYNRWAFLARKSSFSMRGFFFFLNHKVVVFISASRCVGRPKCTCIEASVGWSGSGVGIAKVQTVIDFLALSVT
jgi:hypothetical protein